MKKNIEVYKFYPTLVILSLITTDSLSSESSKLEYFRISEGFQLEYCLNLGIGLMHIESSLFQVATLISIYCVNYFFISMASLYSLVYASISCLWFRVSYGILVCRYESMLLSMLMLLFRLFVDCVVF